MKTKLMLGFVTISFLIIASLSFGAPQQHHEKQELRNRLFQQVIADFKDLRECMEGEEGGLNAGQDKMTVTEVDLNRDGVNEYQVEMGGPCACGTGVLPETGDYHIMIDADERTSSYSMTVSIKGK